MKILTSLKKLVCDIAYIVTTFEDICCIIIILISHMLENAKYLKDIL